MTEQQIAGKDLRPGDKVIQATTGKVLTIKNFSRGFVHNSRLAEYERSAEWTAIFNDVLYTAVPRSKDGDE